MKEWKALLSINLSLALLLGAVCPVAFAEEEPTEVLPVEESVPVEDAGDLPPSEEDAGDENDGTDSAPAEAPEDPAPTEEETAAEVSEEEAQLQELTGPLSGTCGENAVWTLAEDGTLTVSGSGDMKNYTEDSMPWYANRDDVTKVVVEEGITAIGDYAFSNCRNLAEAELNSSVLTSIGDHAFQNDTAMQTLSGSETAAVTAIGDYAFDNCTALVGIDLFSGLERIGAYAFQNCDSLTAVTLPDSVTAMGEGAFYSCDDLTTVTLSAGMTEIPDYAFYRCYYLTTVTIPDSVTVIGSRAFDSCNRLKNLELPAGLETIGNRAFWGCDSLQTVTIGREIQTIGSSAFGYCDGLQTVTIGSGIQTIGRSAFTSCSALQTVTIDTYRMLVDASDAFDSSTTVLWKQADENTALKTWDIGTPTASSAQATLYGDGRLVVSGKGAITSGGWITGNVNAVIVEDGITSIGSSAFSSMSNLKTVTIRDTVTTIDSEAFSYCSNLKSVTIGKGIRTIDYNAFSSCSALETVTIDNYEMLVSLGNNAFPSTAAVTYRSTAGEAVPLQSWEIGTQDETDATATLYTDGRLVISGQGSIKTGGWNKAAIKAIEIQDGITSIPESAFYEYTALESVQIGDGIRSIPYQAFSFCTALREITLPDSVTSIGGYAFYGCSALETVSFPKNLTSIGYNAFENCSSLREVDLPDSVSTIGEYAFSNCRSLETLHLPESLSTIQSSAFANCASLREVVIPDGVTTIEYRAFLNAASLEKLTIGQGVRTIGNSAFANCYGLKELYWNVPAYETFSSTSNVFAAAGRDSGGFDLHLGAGVRKIPAYMFYTSSSAAAGNEVNLLHVNNGSDCLQSVGSFAFYRCLNLSSIELGQTLAWIGDGSFNTCPSLTATTLPESLTSIGRKAFFRSGLTCLETWDSLTSIGEQAFDECGSGFTLVGFTDSYAATYAGENGIPFTPYAEENTATLTVHGNSNFMDYVRSLKTLVGKVVSLLSYSNSTQDEVNRYTSSANLVGWNTQPDGRGTDYAKDAQVRLDADTDLYAQWEERSIDPWTQEMAETGLLQYLDLYQVKPDTPMTRLDIAKLAVALAGWDISGYSAEAASWPDCGDLTPMEKRIILAVGDHGALMGYDDGTWCPSAPITAAASAKVLYEVLGKPVVTIQKRFADVAEGSTFYVYIETLHNLDVIPDVEYFYPGNVATMRQVVEWMINAQNLDALLVASGHCGANVTWTLNNLGTLKISGQGAMDDYDDTETIPWKDYRTQINQVVVENGVTRIGEYAFWDCYQMTSVSIGDTVKTIGAWAFESCYTLTGVVLPDSVNTVEHYAFGSCKNLQSVAIGSGIRTIESQAFDYCKNLKTVTIGAPEIVVDTWTRCFPENAAVTYAPADDNVVCETWNIGSYDETDVTATLYASGRLVIEGRGGFDQSPWSKKITSVEIKDGITGIGSQVFENCRSLRSVTMADSVTSVEWRAFRVCTAMEAIHLSENLKYIRGYAFEGCSALKSLVIPNSVQQIDHSAFNNCTALQSVTIGRGLRYLGNSAFNGCTALTEVHWNAVRYSEYDSESKFAYAGQAGEGITLTIGKDVEQLPPYLFYTSDTQRDSAPKLVSVVVSKGSALREIGEFTFYRCADLTNVVLPDGLESIGDGAFNTCTSLVSMTLPDGLQSIGRKAFFRTALTEITVPFNLSYIGEDAFAQCSEGFSMTVTENTYAQEYATENNIPVTVLPDTTVTLTLNGNNSFTDFCTSVKAAVGKVISLLSYSRNMQNEMNRYTSSANLVGWNTQPNGTGTAYGTDAEITLEQPLDLYAQWDTARITIDGNAYPVDEPCSGEGWTYEPGELRLENYHGDSITVQGSLNLTVAGDCTVNGQLSANWMEITLERDAGLTVAAETEPAVKGTNVCLDGPGTFTASSSGPVCVECSYFDFGGNLVKVELHASQRALAYKRGWGCAGGYHIYNDPTAAQPASYYNGGPYLRMEHDVQTFTFHANGGVWKDQTGDEKQITNPDGTEFDLAELRDLISRPGYVLSGWMAENDQLDFGVNGTVTQAGDLTLYAQWTAADSFAIGGTSYRADQAASGTGWRFAPAHSETLAVLTLDSAYAGGEIYTAVPLQIVVNSTVSITADIGKPGVETLQDLDIRVNSGSLTVTAGDGCDAIAAQGNVTVTVDGALAARGGAGGLAIRSMGSVLLTGSDQITLTGGQNACAVWADKDVEIQNTGDTYLISSNWNAVSSGNLLLLDDGLKVYAGQNTGDAVRVESLADAWGPYIHTKKKSVSVVLMANGGLLDGETMAVMELPESAENEIQLSVVPPERKGYTFLGWNSKDDGSGIAYEPNESYQLSAAQDQLTLFAQWESTGFDFANTCVTVQCTPPKETNMLLLALYDTNGQLISTTVGYSLDKSTWRFDSKFAETCSSMKVIALDEGSCPLMAAMPYPD